MHVYVSVCACVQWCGRSRPTLHHALHYNSTSFYLFTDIGIVFSTYLWSERAAGYVGVGGGGDVHQCRLECVYVCV